MIIGCCRGGKRPTSDSLAVRRRPPGPGLSRQSPESRLSSSLSVTVKDYTWASQTVTVMGNSHPIFGSSEYYSYWKVLLPLASAVSLTAQHPSYGPSATFARTDLAFRIRKGDLWSLSLVSACFLFLGRLWVFATLITQIAKKKKIP